MDTDTQLEQGIDYLICPTCSGSIFRIIRDLPPPYGKAIEWAICLECNDYTVVTHLEESPDDYTQKRIAKP